MNMRHDHVGGLDGVDGVDHKHQMLSNSQS